MTILSADVWSNPQLVKQIDNRIGRSTSMVIIPRTWRRWLNEVLCRNTPVLSSSQ